MNTDNLRAKWIEVEASVWEAQQAEVKALREKIRRLHAYLITKDEFISEHLEEIRTLRAQLAELRQDGEAVAIITTDEHGSPKSFVYTGAVFDMRAGEHRLYTRPQPAIPPGYAVPDEMETVGFFESSEQEISEKSYCSGWNDCRNAMLAAPADSKEGE